MTAESERKFLEGLHNGDVLRSDGSVVPSWAIVKREQCRPDELCIGCRCEMGDTHGVLCYVMANARRDARK